MTITTGQGCQSCSRSASWRGKMNYSLSPFAPENFWSRETGSAVPSRVSLLISILQAESSACLRDFSRVPLRRPFIIGISSTVTMLRQFDQWVLVHKIKVPREDLGNTMNPALRPCLMGPKSRILEIWNRAIFGFQEKILSYGLEIGPFSRIWFSRIGRGRQVLENGHPFSRGWTPHTFVGRCREWPGRCKPGGEYSLA